MPQQSWNTLHYECACMCVCVCVREKVCVSACVCVVCCIIGQHLICRNSRETLSTMIVRVYVCIRAWETERERPEKKEWVFESVWVCVFVVYYIGGLLLPCRSNRKTLYTAIVCECVCECVCERESVCVWERACVWERENQRMRKSVYVCAREREHESMRECVCVRERERGNEREKVCVCESMCVCACVSFMIS